MLIKGYRKNGVNSLSHTKHDDAVKTVTTVQCRKRGPSDIKILVKVEEYLKFKCKEWTKQLEYAFGPLDDDGYYDNGSETTTITCANQSEAHCVIQGMELAMEIPVLKEMTAAVFISCELVKLNEEV